MGEPFTIHGGKDVALESVDAAIGGKNMIVAFTNGLPLRG